MIRTIGTAAGVTAVFACAAAHADCLDGLRNVTANETQYQKCFSAALKDALPAPPPNRKFVSVRETEAGG